MPEGDWGGGGWVSSLKSSQEIKSRKYPGWDNASTHPPTVATAVDVVTLH